ncbi:hypothetical protein K505DRAFT_158947 [Melanomma pulvis-pyrius CBS 109.77]|uniref:Secreted protein n=1 Tax=Melanomma pulvis-pyrius CBS 109.77 TaxID=1314802 RepID=A0A6A6WP42_9PLEO|nr:hypothetical protein K505DRAFT_158947 [Melanomma pulvis-pyrius CBS 109.77]
MPHVTPPLCIYLCLYSCLVDARLAHPDAMLRQRSQLTSCTTECPLQSRNRKGRGTKKRVDDTTPSLDRQFPSGVSCTCLLVAARVRIPPLPRNPDICYAYPGTPWLA